MKNFLKKLSPFFVLILAATVCITLAGCGNNGLSDREQAIYQLVLDASYKFKNPSSVRVVSGKATYTEITDENINDMEYSDLEIERRYFITANLRISATNGYGATTTEYYHIIYDRQGKIATDNLDDTLKDLMDAAEKADSLTKPYLLQSLQAAVDWYDECELLDDFDIDKINAALEKKWNP